MIRKELARSGFEPPTSWLETIRSATISLSVTPSLPRAALIAHNCGR